MTLKAIVRSKIWRDALIEARDSLRKRPANVDLLSWGDAVWKSPQRIMFEAVGMFFVRTSVGFTLYTDQRFSPFHVWEAILRSLSIPNISNYRDLVNNQPEVIEERFNAAALNMKSTIATPVNDLLAELKPIPRVAPAIHALQLWQRYDEVIALVLGVKNGWAAVIWLHQETLVQDLKGRAVVTELVETIQTCNLLGTYPFQEGMRTVSGHYRTVLVPEGGGTIARCWVSQTYLTQLALTNADLRIVQVCGDSPMLDSEIKQALDD